MPVRARRPAAAEQRVRARFARHLSKKKRRIKRTFFSKNESFWQFECNLRTIVDAVLRTKTKDVHAAAAPAAIDQGAKMGKNICAVE